MSFVGLASKSDYFDYLEKCKQIPGISIELSSICNFHCYYCNHPKLKRKKEFVSDKMFYFMVDQVLDACRGAIGVNWAGEATLHPKFFEYCKYINDRGIKVALPTNGSTLSTRFLDVDFSWIQIYLDICQESFSRRGNGDYTAHMARIKNFTKAWLASGSTALLRYFVPTPKTEVGESAQADTRSQFVYSFLHDVGLPVDSVDFGSRIIYSYTKPSGGTLRLGQMPIISGGIFPVTPDNPAPSFNHMSRDHGFCDSCWKSFKLTVDGRMTLCCQALEGSTIFSKPEDIRKNSILDVWRHHPEIERFRENMKVGKLIYNCCKECLDVFPRRELYHPGALAYSKQVPDYSLGQILTAQDIIDSGYAQSGFSPLIVSSQAWTMAPSGSIKLNANGINPSSQYILRIEGVFRSAADNSDRKYIELFVNNELLTTIAPNDGSLNTYEIQVDGVLLSRCSPVEIQVKTSMRPEHYLALVPANLPRHGIKNMVLVEKS